MIKKGAVFFKKLKDSDPKDDVLGKFHLCEFYLFTVPYHAWKFERTLTADSGS